LKWRSMLRPLEVITMEIKANSNVAEVEEVAMEMEEADLATDPVVVVGTQVEVVEVGNETCPIPSASSVGKPAI